MPPTFRLAWRVPGPFRDLLMTLDKTGVRVQDGVSDAGSGTERLADDFAALARAVQAEGTVQHTLGAVCQLAVSAIDGVAYAAITVVRAGRRFGTLAASIGIPPVVDRIQYETGQGPCVDAIHSHQTVAWDNRAAGRWPEFTSRMSTATGVRSMVSYAMCAQDNTLGALNLYSTRPDAFGDRSRLIGGIFAAHASIAMRVALDHEQIGNLQQALQTSRRIGAAVGILMCRHTITEDEAFQRVRSFSQNTNRKIRDIADDIVLTGMLEPYRPTMSA